MSLLTPRRMALVGCGKEKLPRPAPARELYTGPLFRAALAVAEAEFGADVWILSARHGLVGLDENVEPYDLALGELCATTRGAWALDVIRNLTDDDHGSPAHLTVYAGAPYVDALRGHLPRGWSLEDPLAGLGQGQRLSWLKGRLGTPTPLTTSPAGPSGSALLESSVSAPRLTDEQREQHFHRGLELERALAELPALKARFLEALARQEEALRAQHTRHFAAATTGEDPDAQAQQQDLPLDAPASAQPTAQKRSKPAPRKDEQPDPEPPTGPGRLRRRPATEAKGEKRAGKAASARVAAVADAAPVEDDAVPAPAVPCCTCGDSLADHTSPQGAIGACHAKKCSAKPRCQAFQLGRVLGWTLSWQGGWKETGDQPVFFLSQRETDIAKHGPLLSREGGLVYADPVLLGRGTDVLEAARAKGEWSCVKGLRGVPLRVLEVVARVLAAPGQKAAAVSSASQEEQVEQDQESSASAAAKPDDGNLWWAVSDGLDLEVTDAGTGKARLWVVTRSRGKARRGPLVLDAAGSLEPAQEAGEDCRRWFNGKDSLAERLCVEGFLEESAPARVAVALVRPGAADTEATCDGCGETFKASQLQPVGPKGARCFYCANCRAELEAQDERPAPPAAPTATPQASTPVESSAQLELEGDSAPEGSVSLDSVNLEEVTDLRNVLRSLNGAQGSGPRAARVRHIVSVLALSAREESWSHLAGHAPWLVVLHPTGTRGEVWLSHDRRALGTAGPWLWDGKTLTRADDWEAPRKWHVKGESAEEALRALEPALRAALALPAESPAPPSQEDTGGTWRVELPERLEGRDFIIPLWLVNDALVERRAASWWGRSGLKPSHHLSGTLRDAALEEHVALQAWWKEHAETVVKPLEQACRDGAVPGLSVASPVEPHAVGPFFYALSGGWRLEVWEPWKGEPHAYFANGTERHGPFAWEKGWLVASDVGAISWAQGAAHVVREAEDFITRGFVLELRRAEGRR